MIIHKYKFTTPTYFVGQGKIILSTPFANSRTDRWYTDSVFFFF